MLTSPKRFTKGFAYDAIRYVVPEGITNAEGARWKYLQRLVTPCFHSTVVEALVPAMSKIADVHMQAGARHCKEGRYLNVSSGGIKRGMPSACRRCQLPCYGIKAHPKCYSQNHPRRPGSSMEEAGVYQLWKNDEYLARMRQPSTVHRRVLGIHPASIQRAPRIQKGRQA